VCLSHFLAESDVWQAFREIKKGQEEDRKRQEEDRKRQIDMMKEFKALKKPRASVTTHTSAGADAISNAEVVHPRHLITLSTSPVSEEVLEIVAGWANCQREEDLQVGWFHRSYRVGVESSVNAARICG
jgi:hypothetical protein